MPKIKAHLRKKFNPTFTTKIRGSVVRLSINDLENNPEKYAHTHMVEFYENSEDVKSRAAKSKKRAALKLNMGGIGVSRGLIFEEGHQTEKEKAIERFLNTSLAKTKRLKAQYLANKAKEEALEKETAKVTKKPKAKSKAETEAEAKAELKAKEKAESEAKEAAKK
jgi:hypothetical protein